MKKLITLTIIIAILTSCALKPAPITLLDTHTVTPETRDQTLKEITIRKKKLHQHIDIPWPFWIIAPFTTGIVWLCFIPARIKTNKELRELEEKEKEITPLPSHNN